MNFFFAAKRPEEKTPIFGWSGIMAARFPQECQVGANAENSKKFSMLIPAQQETHT